MLELRYQLKQWIKGKISLYVARKYFKEKNTRLFDVIELELRSLCNGTCPFCAAAVQYNNRPDISMADDMFRKIIDELGQLNYGGRISFYVNTESLLDPRLTVFVRYARGKCPGAYLHVMTNGKLLQNDLGKELLDSGLDLFEINHYSDNQILPLNIKKFMDEIAPSYPSKVKLHMRKLTIQLYNRAGSSPNGKVIKKPFRAFCQRPFQKLIISVEGKAGLCEHDFYFEEVMGNINKENLKDIWYSEKFRRVRKVLVEGNRSIIPLCSKCDFSGFRRISNPFKNYGGPKYSQNRTIGEWILEKIDYVITRIA